MLAALGVLVLTGVIQDDPPIVRNGGFELPALPPPHTPILGRPLPDFKPSPLNWILENASWGEDTKNAIEGSHVVALFNPADTEGKSTIRQEIRLLPKGSQFEVTFSILNQTGRSRVVVLSLTKYNLATRSENVTVSPPGSKSETAWTTCKQVLEWDSVAFPTPRLTISADSADKLLLDNVSMVKVR